MRKTAILFCAFALAAGLFWTVGSAQPIVPENHFLVYDVPENNTFTASIALADQFGLSCVYSAELDLFATPVDKNGEGIYDDVVHHTWWKIDDPQSAWQTSIENQFGVQNWMVKNGRYLLLPALKNTPGTPPIANHYKCYEAEGDPVNIPVTLVDQFGTYSMVATDVIWFCNPTSKCVEGGDTYEIVENQAHLACYLLEPVISTSITAMAYDQFGDWQLTLEQPCWLCLPTKKTGTVPTEPTSWGRIKALYKN